jgi:hypothetical protein
MNSYRPLRLTWIYPDLLSTYGDRGNLLVLERRARLRDMPVDVIEVNSDQRVPADGDIYLMGGGEDLPQTLATRRLQADGGLHEAVRRGAVLFAVCAGYQMPGRVRAGLTTPLEGLGLLDPQRPGRRRGVSPRRRGPRGRRPRPPGSGLWGRHPAGTGARPLARSSPASATGTAPVPTRGPGSRPTCRVALVRTGSPTCCSPGRSAGRCRHCRRRRRARRPRASGCAGPRAPPPNGLRNLARRRPPELRS